MMATVLSLLEDVEFYDDLRLNWEEFDNKEVEVTSIRRLYPFKKNIEEDNKRRGLAKIF